ncbi:Rid family hydrolase [Micromonospora sp. NPDC006766]|uniref:Rid family hydrolase n=1 Tax=Micromonospora sp. NPDC006766 TaxID=3154778 RepID=UPI00340C7900
MDDDGAIVEPGDVRAQSERIFALIGGLLAAHGATFDDVMHVRTFMTDLREPGRLRGGPQPILPALPSRQHHRGGEPALPGRGGAGGRGDRCGHHGLTCRWHL